MTGREHVVRIVPNQELVKALGEPKTLKLGPQNYDGWTIWSR